jgi:hypothetical protein
MLGGCRRGDQGVMSLGEGHGDQWSLVECLERRPRGMLLWRGTWGSPEIGRLETRTRTCRRLLEGN